MERPSLTKERREIKIGIERFFVLFLNIQKREIIYKIKRIGKRADLCPILTSALKNRNVK